MEHDRATKRGLSVARGGSGERLFVLLHGLGANASVWSRMTPLIETSRLGRWIAPDLRGHGRSVQEPPYGFGMHAADVADLIASEGSGEVTLIGHSFGGVVAALVATGWFGSPVRDVAAFGVKIDWTADEIGKARDMAQRPQRTFTTRAEAVDRYLKVSGLTGLLDPSSSAASLGVVGSDGRYRVAMDMRAYGAVGPSIEGLLRLADVPLRLAAGSKDPMSHLSKCGGSIPPRGCSTASATTPIGRIPTRSGALLLDLGNKQVRAMRAQGVRTAEDEAQAKRLARDFDIKRLDQSFLDDPYPVYRALREHDPVHRMPDSSYFLSRYDDCAAVYRDPVTWSSDKKIDFRPNFGTSSLYEHHTTSLVFNDPPYHSRVRKLLAPAFTPRAESAATAGRGPGRPAAGPCRRARHHRPDRRFCRRNSTSTDRRHAGRSR